MGVIFVSFVTFGPTTQGASGTGADSITNRLL